MSILVGFLTFLSIALGWLTGIYCNNFTELLKPLSAGFLNLIFCFVVPLVFLNISCGVSRAKLAGKIGKLFISIFLTFFSLSLIAAISSIIAFGLFPPIPNPNILLVNPQILLNQTSLEITTSILTTPEFLQILTHENMLPLIVFSVFIGLNIGNSYFYHLLEDGQKIIMDSVFMILKYTPIGYFAYAAVTAQSLAGFELNNYLSVVRIYYIFSIIYFVVLFTLYAHIANGQLAIKLFWKNIAPVFFISFITCSGTAAIPNNLIAAKLMRVSKEIYETAIPIGTVIHKHGSIIGAVIKIIFLFKLFNVQFLTLNTIFATVIIAILIGIIIGPIPGGGMFAELLILSAFGFPISALAIISTISILIDPMATALNSVGNTASSLLIASFVKIDNSAHPKKISPHLRQKYSLC